MKDFRVIVSGSRNFDDYDELSRVLDEYFSLKKGVYNLIIISGTTRGADQLGEKYAQEHGYPVEKYPMNSEQYGKNAASKRNNEMVDVAETLIAFWDGESFGTKHLINSAKEKGLNVKVVRFKKSMEKAY